MKGIFVSTWSSRRVLGHACKSDLQQGPRNKHEQVHLPNLTPRPSQGKEGVIEKGKKIYLNTPIETKLDYLLLI